jgi:hypothetical protein
MPVPAAAVAPPDPAAPPLPAVPVNPIPSLFAQATATPKNNAQSQRAAERPGVRGRFIADLFPGPATNRTKIWRPHFPVRSRRDAGK